MISFVYTNSKAGNIMKALKSGRHICFLNTSSLFEFEVIHLYLCKNINTVTENLLEYLNLRKKFVRRATFRLYAFLRVMVLVSYCSIKILLSFSLYSMIIIFWFLINFFLLNWKLFVWYIYRKPFHNTIKLWGFYSFKKELQSL